MSCRPTLSRGALQREPHPRAVTDLAIDPDASAVGFHDALGDGQAESHAGRVAVGAHAVEALEQSSLLLGSDARPLVLDANRYLHATLGADPRVQYFGVGQAWRA